MLRYRAVLTNSLRLSLAVFGRLGFLVVLSAPNFAATAFAIEDRVRVAGFTESEGGVLCGPLSLALAIRMLGGDATIHEIVDDVELTHEGTSLNELQIAARKRGYLAEGFKLDSVRSIRLLTEDTPAILQLRGNHFGAVWSRGGEIQLVEFPYERRTVSKQALEAEWNPTILVIRRTNTPDPFQAPEKTLRINEVLIPASAILLALAGYLVTVRTQATRVVRRFVSRSSKHLG